jgi:quercetin dioxygenase-like cupin family protein
MDQDPVVSNPDNYRLVFENERVRVLEYRDDPGAKTTEHSHPDSVMITLNGFRRRLFSGGRELDVEMPAGAARWVPAQTHSGMNIGDTPTHSFFIELKESGSEIPHGGPDALGPDAP